MAAVKVNLAAASKTVPNSVYKFNITNVERKPSKSSPFDYFNWTLVVAEGKHAGLSIDEMTSLSPKAAFRLYGFLKSCGVVIPETQEELENFEFDPQEQLGKQILGETEVDYSGDAPQSKIKKFYPIGQEKEIMARVDAAGPATSTGSAANRSGRR